MQVDSDRIDRIRAQWAQECPNLDTAPMEIIGRILRAEHLADGPIRRTLRQHGLDRGGFDVLATLRRSGPPYQLTPTQLYEDLVLTSGAITHRVDALQRLSLVERVSGQPDRRSMRVGLTAKGKKLIDRALGAHLECEQALIAGLSPAERDRLAVLLKKVLLEIEEQHERQ